MERENQLPNEELLAVCNAGKLFVDKFQCCSEGITNWYWNPDGNEENGILQEEWIPNSVISEAVSLYKNAEDFDKGLEEFWTHWNSYKIQYNYDNIEGDEDFIIAMKEFCTMNSDYNSGFDNSDFVTDIYHGNEKEEFNNFIKFLEEHLQNED